MSNNGRKFMGCLMFAFGLWLLMYDALEAFCADHHFLPPDHQVGAALLILAVPAVALISGGMFLIVMASEPQIPSEEKKS